jgi:hypothetical protein
MRVVCTSEVLEGLSYDSLAALAAHPHLKLHRLDAAQLWLVQFTHRSRASSLILYMK